MRNLKEWEQISSCESALLIDLSKHEILADKKCIESDSIMIDQSYVRDNDYIVTMDNGRFYNRYAIYIVLYRLNGKLGQQLVYSLNHLIKAINSLKNKGVELKDPEEKRNNKSK
jgi:hypothetical protein